MSNKESFTEFMKRRHPEQYREATEQLVENGGDIEVVEKRINAEVKERRIAMTFGAELKTRQQVVEHILKEHHRLDGDVESTAKEIVEAMGRFEKESIADAIEDVADAIVEQATAPLGRP